MIDAYHHFKVPEKSDVEKSIIFQALGDLDKRGRQGNTDNANISIAIPDERYSLKARMICQG